MALQPPSLLGHPAMARRHRPVENRKNSTAAVLVLAVGFPTTDDVALSGKCGKLVSAEFGSHSAGEKLVLHKLRFHPDLVAPFSPPCEGGVRGVVPTRPVTRSSHALSLSVLSHPSREARRIVFDFQGSRITPPNPPFARGGKGSLARNLIPSRAIKTRVSKPSLQLGQHQLFTGPVRR